jgi:hypothetical protein
MKTNKLKHKKGCECPFCPEELKFGCIEPQFCAPCGLEKMVCEKCGKLIKTRNIKCPDCGGGLKKFRAG